MQLKIYNLLAILFLSACSLAPEYQTPESPIVNQWDQKSPQEQEKLAAKLTPDQFFKSPELQKLIERGLANNRDLRQAVLNIGVVKAQYGVLENLFPDIEANAQMTDQKIVGSGTRANIKSRQYSINIGTTAFEIDLFDRLGSLQDAALEEYFGIEDAAQTVRITLIGEIARTYMTLLANRQQLLVANRTVRAQQLSYDLIKKRFEAGVSTKLDLSRAQTVVQTAIVDFNARTRLIKQSKTALELLVGTRISDQELQGKFSDLAKSFAKINSGLPSDLLLNRPDIRQAEHALKAANANIGAARAAFFPRVTLTATTGFGTRDLSNLFDSTSQTWLFSPQVTLPIFTWGRNQANLDVAELRKDISIANYEKTIQTAFKEVSDALISYEYLEKEAQAQYKLVLAANDAKRLAKARYDKGIDNYLSVLDAVRDSYGAEQQLINKNLAKMVNKVSLYAALGGGQVS